MTGEMDGDGVFRVEPSRRGIMAALALAVTVLCPVVWDMVKYEVARPAETQALRDAIAENTRNIGQLSELIKVMVAQGAADRNSVQNQLTDHEHRISDIEGVLSPDMVLPRHGDRRPGVNPK